MKQEISALMDGELFEDEAVSCLAKFKSSSDAQKNWAIYHLIGDALRQPEHISANVSAAVSVRLADEPTVFAPRGQMVQHKTRHFALSAAATLAAMGIVAWMSLQISPQATPQMAMQQTPTQQLALTPASMRFKPSANEYLMAHQEFSPSTDMNGGATYIRTVAYNVDGK